MNSSLAYLIGLICGRGKIYRTGRVVIEFAHANEFISGLSLCPTCGSASSKSKKDGLYHCKNSTCKQYGFKPIEKKYDQRQETISSINDTIVPFLKKSMAIKQNLLSNKSITLLIIDFEKNGIDWENLNRIFGDEFDFHYGRVPREIYQVEKSLQVEFMNGILDTSGFCNKGNQQGIRKTTTGNEVLRQRVYIQIVRNWHMVIDLDEILRNYLNIPVQTIRWAHPNLDDGKLLSINAGIASQQREHQIKLHPEFMGPLKFRISHKNKIFDELKDFNAKAGFQKENWIDTNKTIRQSQMTPNHPLETNPRFPVEVRQHFDSSWQVALALGCKDMQKIANDAKNPKNFKLTGDIFDGRPEDEVEKEIATARFKLNIKYPHKSSIAKNLKSNKKIKTANSVTEIDTYPILVKIFDEYLFESDALKGKFYEVATLSLSSYAMSKPEIFSRILDEIEQFKIHVDLIGYDKINENIIIVESKIDPLTIEMVGQLLGYCLVAQPQRAYLVSTCEITPSLLNSISANPHLLDYGNDKRIMIGKLDIHTETVSFK